MISGSNPGKFLRVCLAFVVGMSICFDPALWGIFTLWGRHCGAVKEVPHSVRYYSKKSPQCWFCQWKKIFPIVLSRKFQCRILRCGECILTNYHPTFHGRYKNLQSGELCKLTYFLIFYLYLFWITTPSTILHCGEELRFRNFPTRRYFKEIKSYNVGNYSCRLFPALWGRVRNQSSF